MAVMNLIEIDSDMEHIMLNKYNLDIPSKDIACNVNRLTNQIWKLIPMRENNENWENQIDKVIVELTGLYNIFKFNDKFITLLANLEGLKLVNLEFDEYRSKIFESITLLRDSFNESNR